jgi:hypothetical protein
MRPVDALITELREAFEELRKVKQMSKERDTSWILELLSKLQALYDEYPEHFQDKSFVKSWHDPSAKDRICAKTVRPTQVDWVTCPLVQVPFVAEGYTSTAPGHFVFLKDKGWVLMTYVSNGRERCLAALTDYDPENPRSLTAISSFLEPLAASELQKIRSRVGSWVNNYAVTVLEEVKKYTNSVAQV